MTRMWLGVAVWAIASGVLSPTAVYAQPDGPIGLVLSQLRSQVEQLIDHAKNAGLTLEMELGRQMILTIDAAEKAYSDQLKNTVATVDPKVRGSINQLSSSVNEFEAKFGEDVSSVMSSVQRICDFRCGKCRQVRPSAHQAQYALGSRLVPWLAY